MSTVTHPPLAPPSGVPEATLVAAAQRGDLAAFEQLVQRYEPRVLRLAMRIVGNEADAEDVMQEAFLKAYAKLGQFQRQSSFYTWVVRIAVNEALMRLRRRRGGKELSLDEEMDTGEELLPREIEDWRPNPEQQLARQELHDLLGDSIASLALPYRVVFQLRDVEGLSTEETADVLRLTIPAVKSRLLRARLQLRNKLSRHFRRPEGETA
ncbi:MAG: sigma-70 family RNA polymerase sigma factor [Terriglobales bacterium]